MNQPPALHVESLCVQLTSGLPIVESLTLDVEAGEILGLVGESGSGKTTAALALLGFTRPGVRISAGTVAVIGQQVTGVSPRTARQLRGQLISYVPQDPATSLNPALRVGDQI